MSSLFDKIILNNGVEIKNRLVIAPITLFSSNSDGSLNDAESEYLKFRGTEIVFIYFRSNKCESRRYII